MKKSPILTSLLVIFAVCFSTTAFAERTSSQPPSRIAFSIDAPVPIGNSEFSTFMYDKFQMTTPNIFIGGGLSFGAHFTESRRWLWEIGANFRHSYRSSNNITRSWNQNTAFLTFSYAIIDNNWFRLSPFAGAIFIEDRLYYADMREIGDLDNITDVLETSFLQLNLNQWGFGGEFGLRFDFFAVERTARPVNPHFSAFIKWEQGFFSSYWRIERLAMRDIPKFQHGTLSIGIGVGF